MRNICRGIAQLVEQRSPKPRVESSSLSAPAKRSHDVVMASFFLRRWLRFCGGCPRSRPQAAGKCRNCAERRPLTHYAPGFVDVADGLFCREIDGLFCRSSPDIIVRRRCVLSHKRRGWLQPSPSFRYSRNLALQDELYHPVINNGPAVLVCVDKRLGTGPVNQSRDAG